MSNVIQKYAIPGLETVGGAASEFFAPGNPAGIAAITGGATQLAGNAMTPSTSNGAAPTPFNDPDQGAAAPQTPQGGLAGAVQSLAPLAGGALGMLGGALAPKPGTPPQAKPQTAPMQATPAPAAPPRTAVAGNATGGSVGPAATAAPAVAKPAGLGSGGNSLAQYAQFLRQMGIA